MLPALRKKIYKCNVISNVTCNETEGNEDFEKCSLAHRSAVHKHVEEDAEAGKNQQNQTDGYHCLGGFEPVYNHENNIITTKQRTIDLNSFKYNYLIISFDYVN